MRKLLLLAIAVLGTSVAQAQDNDPFANFDKEFEKQENAEIKQDVKSGFGMSFLVGGQDATPYLGGGIEVYDRSGVTYGAKFLIGDNGGWSNASQDWIYDIVYAGSLGYQIGGVVNVKGSFGAYSKEVYTAFDSGRNDYVETGSYYDVGIQLLVGNGKTKFTPEVAFGSKGIVAGIGVKF